MSRIGKKTIEIPDGVEVKLHNNRLEVKGSRGTLEMVVHHEVEIKIVEKEINVEKTGKSKKAPAIWGLTRALIDNMIVGVKDGYKKQLELQGVGFRMAVAGKKITMALGFSHPVIVDVPAELEVKIEGAVLEVTGADKQQVGQFAANIRKLKPVEPYKGKGFRYVGEHVRRKAGKKAAK
ncbi:MAG TPA: 50S ribosomal protein L6 [Candidatus Moranbacteria bacterium]|nr:50S ribosomal protein L6 [Candidatus Moranbacteria bacterium]